jgi:putative transposon-encoded protein
MTLNRVDENMEKCITYLDKSVIVNESEDYIGDRVYTICISQTFVAVTKKPN